MEDHQKSGMGPPKRSLDEIIENMTADLHDSDGQYIQLGFTPPPTPATTQHHWSPHSYLPPMSSHQPMYHPEHHPHPNEQPPLPSYLSSRSHSQPTLGGLIPGREMTEGNFVNFVYGSPMGLYVLNEPTNPGMQQILNNYVPYRTENDYGLFMNNPTPTQNPPERNNGLIENLVGNWSSAGSGTYSPFGNGSSPERVVEPPLVIPEERVAPKKRMVAEVRPMRPSYSDVVSKSPPTKPRTLSPGITKTEPIIIKPKVNNKKAVGKKAPGLKRQNSGEEGHKMSENARSPSPPPMVFRRRVSLDFDFEDSAQGDDDDERPDSAQDSSSQSGDNSKQESDKTARPEGDRGMPLNNHKASRPGVAKRPLHINNNLNLPPRATEKNVVKGGRPCKTCGEERRSGAGVIPSSSKGEGKAGPKTRSSSQGRGDKPSQHANNGGRKGKAKKKGCPYSFSTMWPVLHRQLVGWAAVAMRAVTWFLHLLSDVLGMSSKLSWHLCGSVCGRLKIWSADTVKYLRSALPLPRQSSRPGWWSRWMPSWLPWGKKKGWEPSNEPATKLENNLPLPGTGEEAMKRLLACRGKDPYSILGVAPTCTDDDIKRYYKRQAFLVHPDKNNQPGAEEAFKILVHAFDLIGEPEKRQVYDCGVARSHQAEAAWTELSDLLAQLHQKMEEAANTIRCTNCGKRHRRLPVERPCYAARNCAQCKIHHAAREGDIWAESSMMGFLWHYFACMEGAVYDITEWAACQADNLRHLRANSHAVQYRIVLGKKHQRAPPDARRPPDQPSEPDFEDFLNSLYGQGGGGGGSGGARKEGETASQSEHARKRKPRRKK